jgi:hypothetical protein
VVELPDGEVLDIHEFLVCVAGLTGRRGADPLRFAGVATVVADMVAHDREARVDPQSYETPLEFYFRTRAPDLRLLARIDALGAHDLLAPDGPLDTLAALVEEVYGTAEGRDRYRVRGILRLLARYGFTARLVPDWGVDLLSQPEPVAALTERVRRLAAASRRPRISTGPTLVGLAELDADELELRAISAEATAMYLEWLELLTLRYRDELTRELGTS